MTPKIIAFIIAFGFALMLIYFPWVIFNAIEWLDYRLKQLVAKIINFFDQS